MDEGVTVRGEGADLRWGDLLRSGLDAHLDGRALSAAVELLEGDGAADEGELLLTGSELFCDAGAVRFGGWSGVGAGDGDGRRVSFGISGTGSHMILSIKFYSNS